MDLAKSGARPSRRSTTRAAATCSSTTPCGRIRSKEGDREDACPRRRSDRPAQTYARVINYAIAERPADMTITTTSAAATSAPPGRLGGYEPVAEVLLGQAELRRLLPRRRHRARRRVRAAALPAEGQQDRRRRPGHVEERRAREEGRHQAPSRRGIEVRRLRPDGDLAAMRLRLDRGRQHPHRGRAVGKAAPLRRGRRRGVGQA